MVWVAAVKTHLDGFPNDIKEVATAALVQVLRPALIALRDTRSVLRAQKTNVDNLLLVLVIVDGDEVAKFSAGALREVILGWVCFVLNNDVETGGSAAGAAIMCGDKPDESVVVRQKISKRLNC